MKTSFFDEFLKNWREVGSITPSSRFLVKKMLSTVDFGKTNTIVELGAGSGIITREILKKIDKNSVLVVFETNRDFYRDLKMIDDERLTVYNQSALKLQEYLSEQSVDYIISGIPLSNLLAKDSKSLLLFSYKSLRQKGRYIQFQYSMDAKRDLRAVFDKVDVDFTPLNIPPAFVFSCIKSSQ